MPILRRRARFVAFAVSGSLIAVVLAMTACSLRRTYEMSPPPSRTARATVAAMERPAPELNTEAYDRIYDNRPPTRTSAGSCTRSACRRPTLFASRSW